MSLLTAVAVLVTIGVLFAIDPAGAIAESGFPDFQEMDWKQRAFWGFRTIGVVLAQLLTIALWLWPKHRPPPASPWYSGTMQPGSMPAAAVSALQGHAIGSQTLLASIIEMCQRGTLRIEAIGTRVGFLYRLTRQGLTHHAWEQTLCDSLPSRATSVDALREEMDKREEAIGDQIGDYLQQRGLFHDNPVRARRKKSNDGSDWWMVAAILTGAGCGFWAALWVDPWWANVLIGVVAGLVYSFLSMHYGAITGMLKPTQAGALEIGQWFGLKESLTGSEHTGARDHSDPMLPYAVAFNVAQSWLDLAASAPPWFGSGSASSLQGAELNAAYHAFLHAPEWWLTGRSDDAAKAAAQWGYEEELRLRIELEQLDEESPRDEQPDHAADPGQPTQFEMIARDLETRETPPGATAGIPSAEYQPQRWERAIEEEKGGGCLRGCFMGVVGLAAIGALVLVVLFSLDVLSPREKPCSLESLPIPTPAQIAVAGDLFRDNCVSVRGAVVFQDANELLIEVDRDEYVQQVSVRVPTDLFQTIASDRVVTIAGRLIVEEDGTYWVHFIPDRGSDRDWWRNLRENLQGLF